MKTIQDVRSSIRFQWNEMLDKAIVPMFEFQTSDDEWLIIDVNIVNDNSMIIFSFDDDGRDVYFSGDVKKIDDRYCLHVDEYNDNLDHYLEFISLEIVDGFLIPNNIYYNEG